MREFEQRVIDTMVFCEVIPKDKVFEISEFHINEYIKIYGEIFGSKDKGLKKNEVSFARKLAGRTLVRVNADRGAKFNDISAGMVYLISNPVYPQHFKVGMCIDVIDRLNSYQTYDPYRKFKIERYGFVLNRRKAESLILYHPDIFNEQGEWVLRENANEIFSQIIKVL